MNFDRIASTAEAALHKSQHLGFDRLAIAATQSRLFGIRIANSAVCRENIDRLHATYEVRAAFSGREGGFDCAAGESHELENMIRELRRLLEQQPPDREYVAPQIPIGRYSYELNVCSFDDAYSPERIYRSIGELSQRVRAKGLRLTGYVEAQQTKTRRFILSDSQTSEIATHDHGLSVSFTVDDPKTGAVSCGNRGIIRSTPSSVEKALFEAYAEAEHQCLLAKHSPMTPMPGDYTVILHPQAVVDIVNTALMYGMFDRRKVDEGRTYLAGRHGKLKFPLGLSVAQKQSINLGPNLPAYLDMPFNHRYVPCSDMFLIADGQVKDLHTSPFWAKEHGLNESFDANAAAPATTIALAPSAGINLVDDLAALIADTKRGYYIANTWYLRMVAEMEGMITGMTRDGVFAIENGQITGPVLNMRWHDNPFRILSAITGATRETTVFGRSRLAGQGRTRLSLAPALRVDNFHMSSVSKF